jgi:ubiquinol-cytochrome c reductase iron-sulfur subunit
VDKFKAQAEAFEADWKGGFYCPCHGSLFDLAGRVYKNKPAPDNLEVPPYTYLSDTKLLIGEDKKGA